MGIYILSSVSEKLFLLVFHLRNGKRRRAEADLRERVGEEENGWKSGAHRGVRKSHEE